MLTAGKAIEHGEWRCQVKVLEVCCNLETAPLNKRLLSELKTLLSELKTKCSQRRPIQCCMKLDLQ